MWIQLNLSDGSIIYVNTNNVTWFEPQPGQSLECVIHFTDGTELKVAQTALQVRALIP